MLKRAPKRALVMFDWNSAALLSVCQAGGGDDGGDGDAERERQRGPFSSILSIMYDF